MQNLIFLLALLFLISISIQPASAFARYSVDEMAACAPIGGIAMKMTKLQKQGHKWKNIKSLVKKNLHHHLVSWVTPVAKLVIFNRNSSSKKIVKQVIRYCLITNKKHHKPRKERSI